MVSSFLHFYTFSKHVDKSHTCSSRRFVVVLDSAMNSRTSLLKARSSPPDPNDAAELVDGAEPSPEPLAELPDMSTLSYFLSSCDVIPLPLLSRVALVQFCSAQFVFWTRSDVKFWSGLDGALHTE